MNKRMQYRVAAPQEGLQISVLTDAGPVVTRLLDVSAAGAALSVPDNCLTESSTNAT